MLAAAPALAQIEEIVVTARKKEESLQDVPIAVTALTAEDIERKGISTITDVAKLSASLQFDENFSQSDTRIVIRGLSPTRGRQNAAVLVDGIDLSSENIVSSGGSLLINQRLLDIERIEVNKGPQMALYGRAAFNGALQYITKNAPEEFEFEISADGNDEDQYSLSASVGGPVWQDKLALRLNGSWWDEEGFYKNSITGGDLGGEKGFGFALTANANVLDNLSFKFRAEYVDDEGEPSAATLLPFNALLDAPSGAFNNGGAGANIAQCSENIPYITALGEGIPGHDIALIQRAQRIMDPALFGSVVAGRDINDAADARQIVVENPWLNPQCESPVLSFVGQVPDGDDVDIAIAPDPRTPGKDYEGYDRDFYRVSLEGELELEKGTFDLWAGYLRDDNTETQDTNFFGVFDPTSPFLDANPNSFSFDNEKVTEQRSFELRFSSDLDGPADLTVGALYWREEVENDSRSITAQGSGSHCFWEGLSGDLFPAAIANLLGNEATCSGYTETPIAPYQAAAAPLRPTNPVDRDTKHWSFYGMLDIELAEAWTLSLEGRYNRENITVLGPIPYEPGVSGGAGGLNPCGIFFRPCMPFNDWVNSGQWFGDSFFPWTDEDENGNDLNMWVPDMAALAAIPDACRQQDGAAVQNSINNGPVQIEREPDGTPSWTNATPTGTINVVDADGRAVLNENNTDLFNPWCLGTLSNQETWFSPKVTLQWQATDDMQMYFSWADARKPGGFNLLTVGSNFLNREVAEFKPEKMEVWELGAKSAWLDNTLVVNGALFFQDYTDKQALTSVLNQAGDRLISKTVNAGGAEAWGAELDVTWSPIGVFLGGNWTLFGSYTWLDPEYTSFEILSTSTTTSAQAAVVNGEAACTPIPETNQCVISYSGNNLEDAAEGAFVGSIQYTTQLTAGLDLLIETDVQWTDERYTDITNAAWVDAYWNTDFRVGLQGDNWSVLLFVENVFDDDTVRFTGNGPGLSCCFVLGSGIDFLAASQNRDPLPTDVVMVELPLYATAFRPPPRLVGLRANYRFGGGR